MSLHNHQLPSTTWCLKILTYSHIWALPSPAACSSAGGSTRALQKLLLWWPNGARECGTTINWSWTQESKCTRHVSSAPRCMTANHGQRNARQENHLWSFHLHCLQQIFSITWQDKATNAAMLEQEHAYICGCVCVCMCVRVHVCHLAHLACCPATWILCNTAPK